jgi:hypothetical protein
MIRRPRVHPVAPLRVLVGAVVLLVALAAVAGLAEWLRPPAAPPAAPPVPADPRAERDCPPPVGAPPVRVSSSDLYDCPASFDGYTVVYEGEVIGAVLPRGEGAWLQLNDDAYAADPGPLPGHGGFAGGNSGVGVHVPRALADRIAWVGSHRARGDVIAVTGTFAQADPHSGEVAIIRADSGTVLRSGAAITHPPLADRRLAGSILALAALVLLGAGRLAARRR